MGKQTRKIVRQMLERDLANVEKKGPLISGAFSDLRTTTKAQKEIIADGRLSLSMSYDRTIARCRERLEQHAEVGKLPPAPTEPYTFFKEGNAPTAEVTRRR